MDVRAIIILEASLDSTAEAQSSGNIAGTPYGLADVLGQPVVFHILDNLKAHGISDVTVVTDADVSQWPLGTTARGNWIQASREQLWGTVEQSFSGYSQSGTETVLVIRLGVYAEIDYTQLLQDHVELRHHVTSVIDDNGVPLDIYAISGSRPQDAALLFGRQWKQFRARCRFYPFSGYVNRLATPYDLRTLATDGLMQRIGLKPVGHELKPGVWVGRGAHIHRRARVLSPAFIGAGARVRAAAVITRCCALERNTVVDCGTVVEDVSTLPFTYLGAGLDVTHALVGHRRLWNFKRNVEIEFADARLIGEATANAPLRALGSLMSLASFLPSQLLRGIFTPSRRDCAPSLPEAIQAPAAALEAHPNLKATVPSVDAGEFPSNLVVARRYGND